MTEPPKEAFVSLEPKACFDREAPWKSCSCIFRMACNHISSCEQTLFANFDVLCSLANCQTICTDGQTVASSLGMLQTVPYMLWPVGQTEA